MTAFPEPITWNGDDERSEPPAAPCSHCKEDGGEFGFRHGICRQCAGEIGEGECRKCGKYRALGDEDLCIRCETETRRTE